MNLSDGKLLLATVRQGDFAHSGEEAAVVMTSEPLPKRKGQLCLDAGCGRGGTAALVQFNGWEMSPASTSTRKRSTPRRGPTPS